MKYSVDVCGAKTTQIMMNQIIAIKRVLKYSGDRASKTGSLFPMIRLGLSLQRSPYLLTIKTFQNAKTEKRATGYQCHT